MPVEGTRGKDLCKGVWTACVAHLFFAIYFLFVFVFFNSTLHRKQEHTYILPHASN